ncbi:MAG: GspE/PulE family protein [Steroidobacteraceae bacterium]|nr:GspE/PulE family protein [Steroidobacteraceae bacterium]
MSALHALLGEFGVAAPDLDKARAYQQKYGGRLEQILVNMGSLSADALPEIYSRLLGAPVLPARFAATWEPPAGLDALPLDFLLARGWLPIDREDDRWVYAAHAPLDLEVNEWLGDAASYALRLTSEEQFDVLKARLGRRQDSALESSLSSVEEGRLRELASEAPTVNLLNTLIARALKQGASDLHIEPQGSRARVRFRIDGVLHEVDSIAPAMVLPVITRLKILAGMDIGERRRPQDGKIDLRMAGEELDIRVSALPVTDGESAVLRFLRKGALLYDMKLLGLSADVEARVLEDLEVTAGVVLLTGPTGSGKTTTLYTFLSRLNSPKVKIITLEDPVEYQLPGINQVQVQPAIGFDFATGLRSIVRQDPDIIMLGEIRDRETAAIGMQSALTGHLVFSTVHTNDAPSAYTRLLDLGIEEYLLNAALRSILAQRLARRLCEQCAVPHPDAVGIMDRLALHAFAERAGIREPGLRDARGCEACGHTGYRGRMAVVEYLRCDDGIKALDVGPHFLTEARRYCASQGWRSLLEDGYLKALLGQTTIEEVLRVAG